MKTPNMWLDKNFRILKSFFSIGQLDQIEVREFSVLHFNILARRKLSYHMVQTFLPSIFFILITWLCFLIPSGMVEARIGISMTTLLTLTAMFASVRESSPSVSYVRAIDIWMVVCVFFVFLTLFEFSVHLWLNNTKDNVKGEISSETNDATNGKLNEDGVEFKPHNLQNTPSNFIASLTRYNQQNQNKWKDYICKFIEKHAFTMFAIVFTVFCIVFWFWLLIGSNYVNWKDDFDVNCTKRGPRLHKRRDLFEAFDEDNKEDDSNE